MSDKNIFEQATRAAARFPSPVGDLSTEQLWSLPLTSLKGADLNGIAVAINRELKAQGEESFVDTKPNAKSALLALKLDVLKHIIAVKQAENAEKLDAQRRAAEIAKIEEILVSKQTDALASSSVEDLEKRLRELRS